MGGHAGGSIASRLAVQSVLDYVIESHRTPPSSSSKPSEVIPLLTQAVAAGDAAIRRHASANPELKGMGTTLVAAQFCHTPEPQIVIAHIGDSRAYLIRNESMTVLTTDHSFVQRLVSEGKITQDEAKAHPQQHILLKALGAEDQALPDVAVHPLEPQDILLLCTDGLTKTVTEDEILAIVLENHHVAGSACQKLIELANANGGKDNTTVVIVSPTPAPP
jgi:protein phosphatase